MNCQPQAHSLTASETHSLTQSHHPTPPLTCTVSPVSPSLTVQSHPSLTSLTTLRSETTETETETRHCNRHLDNLATPPVGKTPSNGAGSEEAAALTPWTCAASEDLMDDRRAATDQPGGASSITEDAARGMAEAPGAGDQSSLSGHITAGQSDAANGVLLAPVPDPGHCPACLVAVELAEHRDRTAGAWSIRRATLNFAIVVARRACPSYAPASTGELDADV
jgi:hypothetical protein